MKKLFLLLTVLASVLAVLAQPPNITSFSPASGPVGTTVTINGANFSSTPAENIVYFGAVKTPVLSASTTALTVTVPTGATFQPLTVTSNGLTGYAATAFVVASGDFSGPSFEQEFSPIQSSVQTYGDLDSDGKTDVITSFGSTLAVYRNNSTNENLAFSPSVELPLDFSANSFSVKRITLIDIDGDEKKDLIVEFNPYWTGGEKISKNVTAFKNLSTNGAFAFAPEVGLPFKSIGVMGDLNGDGKPEVAGYDADTNTPFFYINTSNSNQISFAADENLNVGGIGIGDVDGDGKNDLITISYDPESNTSSLVLLQNTTVNGVLSFTKADEWPGGYSGFFNSNSFTDLDGDGKPDFVLTSGNRIAVYRNTSMPGAASLAPAVTFPTGDNSYLLAFGDLDGDGKQDVVTADRYYSLSVLRNTSTTGNISFAPFVDYEHFFKNPYSSTGIPLFIGNLDGDGKPDVALGNYIYKNTSSPGAIGLSGRLFFDWIRWSDRATIQDLDGDGKPDLIFPGYMFGEAAVLQNVSSPAALAFERKQSELLTQQRIDAVVDLDGDGKPDLVGVDSIENAYSIRVLQNTSTPGVLSFAAKADYLATTTPVKVLVADLDRDGRTDIIVSSKEILRNTSTGGTLSFEKLSLPAEINATAAGDLNGDGKPELIGAGNKNLLVLQNTSTPGSISFAQELEFLGNGGTVTIADLNGDGKPDLVQKNTTAVSILQNTTAGNILSFTQKQDFVVNEIPISLFDSSTLTHNVAVNDMNGDGKPDLVVFNGKLDSTVFAGAASISMLANISTPEEIAFTKQKEIPYYAPYHYLYTTASLSIGDLDGDNLPDLVVGTTPYWGREASPNFLIFRHKSAATSPLPAFLNDGTIVLDASCRGNDGNISIIPLFGTAPFMYSINGGATYVPGPNTGRTFQELPVGTYQLRLKDANGCESAIVTKEIKLVYGVPCNNNCTPPTFLNNHQIVLDATCGQNDGNITIAPLSGTAPFMYSINGGATYVSGPNAGRTFQNLAPGMYQLRLKDANGCESAIVTREVRQNHCEISAPFVKGRNLLQPDSAEVSAYPNPSKGKFQVQLSRFNSASVRLQVLDARGSMLQNTTVNAKETSVVGVDLTGKAKGLYLVRVISEKGTQVTKVLVQ